MNEFRIDTMTCGHCVRAVTEAVQAVDPAARVEVDLASHRVRVESTSGRETLERALADAGYAPA